MLNVRYSAFEWLSSCRRFSCLALLALLMQSSAAPGLAADSSGDFDLGFLASRNTTLDGDRRLRILGPLYESRTASNGMSLVALRPIFSRAEDPVRRKRRVEFLWPFASVKEMNNERTAQFGIFWETDFNTKDPKSRYRLWLPPFYFGGRDSKGQDYAAVFPLYGSIHEFLTLDSADFFLFPLYMRTMRAGTKTRSFLWPLVTITKGKGISGTKVFPFYSRIASKNMSVRKYVMWPIYTSMRYSQPDGTSGRGYVIFPICGKLSSESDKTWMFLPPFFRWTSGQHGTALNAPWPFIQYSSGKISRFYAWPLLGETREEGIRNSFFMWPFVSSLHRELGSETIEQVAVMPFLQSEIRRPRTVGGTKEDIAVSKPTRRNVNLWPLLHYRSSGAASVLEMPSLWPAASVGSVDKDYAPLWTLYFRSRQGDAVEDDLLWGLFRSRSAPLKQETSLFPLVSYRRSRENEDDIREWSLFKGLIGYSRQGNSRQYRFLYVPLRCRPKEDSPLKPGGCETIEEERSGCNPTFQEPGQDRASSVMEGAVPPAPLGCSKQLVTCAED